MARSKPGRRPIRSRPKNRDRNKGGGTKASKIRKRPGSVRSAQRSTRIRSRSKVSSARRKGRLARPNLTFPSEIQAAHAAGSVRREKKRSERHAKRSTRRSVKSARRTQKRRKR